MHARCIERIVTVGDAQEPCRKLESLGPEPWHLLERRAGAKRTVRLPVADDAARQSVADAGNSRQQRRGCRVDVNAHGIDAILDYRIEGAREFLFAEIVLILAHADRTGDFGQTVGRKGENRISAVQLPSDMLEHAGDSFCIALLLSKILD